VSQVEHFDRLAGRYDDLRAPPGVTALHETLVREADLGGKRVLDVGCGTGTNLRVLAESFGCRVSGVDSSAGMLDEARRKLPDADLRLGVAERLPFDDRSFDAALMSLVVHLLDRPHAFEETSRVLDAGGRLVVVTPDADSFPRAWMAPLFPSYVAVEQARFPSRAHLDAELPAAGFSSVRIVPVPVERRFTREHALARIRGRYASTFDHLSDEEYREGLARAERELPDPVEYLLELLVVVAAKSPRA
jgi:SAM-dependent methyltransferase